MSDTHCDQCGGPFSSAHSDPNLRIILAAKDAEIARLQELVREALARCEGIARAHDLGTPEGARIADGIAALARSLAPDLAQPTLKQFEDMAISALGFAAPDPAEAMRAKCAELEAALRWYAAEGEADEFMVVDGKGELVASFASFSSRAIAALKGKGEGK